MKANHNLVRIGKLSHPLFLIVQRYKNESKSQPMLTDTSVNHVVSNSSKIQKWKQITTKHAVQCCRRELFLIVQRYKNESKSQPGMRTLPLRPVVSNSSKIQKWKQITTALTIVQVWGLLFLIVQRYKNESKSQPRVFA